MNGVLTANSGMYRINTCWNIERAMAASSHLFLHGGIINRLWFSLKLLKKINKIHNGTSRKYKEDFTDYLC